MSDIHTLNKSKEVEVYPISFGKLHEVVSN